MAQYAVKKYQELGGKVITISCWDFTDKIAYTYRKKDGIDYEALKSITDSFGTIDKNKAQDLGYEVLPGEAWLEQEVDILIPAALENQITQDNVEKISPQVKVIVERANGPTATEADRVIQERGIFLVPDFPANAGGVTCSYFEQVQSNMNFYWEKQEMLEKLDAKMTSAYAGVSELARKQKVYMRDAAYIIAINRVAQAVKSRGWV